MKSVDINNLKIGTTTDIELLNHNGEILIHKNVKITNSIIQALARRNIQKIYVREEGEEIKNLLSKKFSNIPDLSIDIGDEPEEQVTESEEAYDDSPAKALEDFHELKEIKKGKEGLSQLLNTSKVKSLEKYLDNTENIPDRPAGPPLEAETTELNVEERTEQYKSKISTDYETALAQTKEVLYGLRSGKDVEGQFIRGIVNGFIETFITDKNILLNLSTSNSKESDYLFNHCLNVCLIAINIASAAGYSRKQIEEIGMGALLHDIGMMLIPQNIRFKKEPLTDDEYFEIRKHPILGLHLLEKISKLPPSVSYVAYQVHERENGKGYPKGRSGRCIHFYARIAMIADIYEALSSPRFYRPAQLPYKTMEFLLGQVRKGILKAELVRSFISYTSLFPVGSLVKLNSGEIAKVVQSNKKEYTKPIISIVTDNNGELIADKDVYQVDLKKNKDIKVVQALGNEKLNIEIMKGF